ncbi:sulfatase [Halococcus sp. PRR34]|uniref:sulfatase n=1 Tax=Halococcus sp. PRR34 TaxID=3020830 RepID=UPI0023629BF9|nr:sulfatase [Halococcus sp. PRR34]
MSEISNVILLSVDALRADHLSSHGYERETSPEIDALAARGTQFMNAFSASSHTREAVPSLLTGRRPSVFAEGGYRLVTESLASRLSKQDFSTAAFHSNPYVSRAYGYGDAFDTFDDDLLYGRNRFAALAQRVLDKFVFNRGAYHARADEINERSLEWLDSRAATEPFFLWNHYMDVHGPYNPPEEYSVYTEQSLSNNEAQRLYQKSIDEPDEITAHERELLIDLYDGEIRYLDAQISAFVEALADRELLSESLVIITADHGDGFGEHGYYAHPRYVYNDLLAVPIVLLGNSVSAGRVETAVSTLDIVPTALEALGVDVDDKLPGQSLLSTVADDGEMQRSVISSAQGEDEASNVRRFAIQDGRFKYILDRDAETNTVNGWQAFDCKDDPQEQDSFSQQQFPETIVDFQSELEAHSKNIGSEVDINESEEDASHEVEQRLKNLGYK